MSDGKLCLIVSKDCIARNPSSRNYANLSIRFGEKKDENCFPTNIGSFYWEKNIGYKDLVIEGFLCKEENGIVNSSQCNIVLRDSYSLEIKEIERIYKTLKSLLTKIDKTEEIQGYIKSYTDYISRICSVLKITEIYCSNKTGNCYSNIVWKCKKPGQFVNDFHHEMNTFFDEKVHTESNCYL